MASYAARLMERWAEAADIRVGGDRPWDVRVHDERVYRRVITTGTLGLGEAYMDGWWDCDAIDEMVDRAQGTGLAGTLSTRLAPVQAVASVAHNQQSKRRSREVGRRHYDVGNDLYRRMLDERMIYSCAYWRRA